MGFVHYAILGALVLTYALPWVPMGKEFFSPGQLVIPYAKFFLKKANVIKNNDDIADNFGDVMTYDKSLRFLTNPPADGGPSNQIIFILIGACMVAAILFFVIPTKLTRIIGSLIALSTTAAFAIAMIFIEHKEIAQLGYGLYGTLGVAFVLLVMSFF